MNPAKYVAIIGDGAFTGGMVYEGMNNIGMLNNLIVCAQRQQDVNFQKRW